MSSGAPGGGALVRASWPPAVCCRCASSIARQVVKTCFVISGRDRELVGTKEVHVHSQSTPQRLYHTHMENWLEQTNIGDKFRTERDFVGDELRCID